MVFGAFSGGIGKWPQTAFFDGFRENLDKPGFVGMDHYGSIDFTQLKSSRSVARIRSLPRGSLQ